MGKIPTLIKGQPTSPEIMQKLKDTGEPVILCFSGGKDSVAAWIAMEEFGIEFTPVYLWYVPHLSFIDEQMEYYQDTLGKRIHQYPNPSFYRWLMNGVAQAPERMRVIEALPQVQPDYDDIWNLVREELDLPGAWLADGVRASDSIVRRASFVRHGVMKAHLKKVSPIADWLKREVMGAIEERGVELPIDYELFGRSFDGIDLRFIEPLKERLPDDYQVLLDWFPLIEADFHRG